MNRRLIIVYCFVCLLSFVNLSCIFSPDDGKKTTQPVGKEEIPTTPRKVIKNLEVAFDSLDIDLYEKSLHENFFYKSPSELDELDIYWNRSEEVRTMRNMMAQSAKIDFLPSEIRIYEEYGKNVPNIPSGADLDVDDVHPDDIWIVCRYYLNIDVRTNEYGDFKAQQDMIFKMVEDPATKYYSIIRWIDETGYSN